MRVNPLSEASATGTAACVRIQPRSSRGAKMSPCFCQFWTPDAPRPLDLDFVTVLRKGFEPARDVHALFDGVRHDQGTGPDECFRGYLTPFRMVALTPRKEYLSDAHVTRDHHVG